MQQEIIANLNLKVEIKNVYGNTLFYPACETSKMLAALIDVKTFCERHIKLMKRIGYNFQLINPTTTII